MRKYWPQEFRDRVDDDELWSRVDGVTGGYNLQYANSQFTHSYVLIVTGRRLLAVRLCYYIANCRSSSAADSLPLARRHSYPIANNVPIIYYLTSWPSSFVGAMLSLWDLYTTLYYSHTVNNKIHTGGGW